MSKREQVIKIKKSLITFEAASRVATIAQALRERGLDPLQVARFLDRIVFTMFAEDVGLLPKDLFTKLAEKTKYDPARFCSLLKNLFVAMADGGDFGLDTIAHFNGNLFSDDTVLELTEDEIKDIHRAAKLDWSEVDPSIFGTLFERGLDPDKRAQLGAHYTSREDIETLVEPVVMTPLRREWDVVRESVLKLITKGKRKPTKKAIREADGLIHDFLTRLSQVKVLDPSCGSGNFLYVALQKLKDLEKEIIVFATGHGFDSFLPLVGPWQLYGIEVNPYAYDLAQMTIWIGYFQWVKTNGYGISQRPVLRTLDTFKNMDAIIDLSDPDNPKEPEWPAVDFIVGNPPFFGVRKMRTELDSRYVDMLLKLYKDRLQGTADLCCYWFEKARAQIGGNKAKRAGLLATQGIRSGSSRETLERIKETGGIFFAVSDEPWILDGAAVQVSMVGFDDGSEHDLFLDGESANRINTDLTSGVDTTRAQRLTENKGLAFYGVNKAGPFDIAETQAIDCLNSGGNPHGQPNSNVVKRIINGKDILRRTEPRWIIDFFGMTVNEAAMYEHPFKHAEINVKPIRQGNRENRTLENWWLFKRTAPAMRHATASLNRYIATSQISKHRIFVFVDIQCLPDGTVAVFPKEDDYTLGVLHSKLHEVWSLGQGTQLREKESGFRYNPQTCFGTFPFPEPTTEQSKAISDAANELNTFRDNWLNPSEWTKEDVLEFPGTVDGPWAGHVTEPSANGIGVVKYPRIVPRDAECAKKLKKRTLTNLYNERPTWLDLAHKKLDEAVFSAYGWDAGISDEEILEKLLELNLERATWERGVQ